MTRNVGSVDKVIRAILAIVAFYLAFFSTTAFASGALFWVALIFGAAMLLTAITGMCPIYRMFGMRTCQQ